MNYEILRRWRERVAEDDEVWIVGDLALGDINYELDLVRSLPGKKFLVPGNHDRCWPGGRPDWREWISVYEGADLTVLTHDPGDTVRVGSFELCHFPPLPDEGERGRDRYSAWRPSTTAVLVHGHIHNNHGAGRTTGFDQINVSVDVWDFYPASEQEILEIL